MTPGAPVQGKPSQRKFFSRRPTHERIAQRARLLHDGGAVRGRDGELQSALAQAWQRFRTECLPKVLEKKPDDEFLVGYEHGFVAGVAAVCGATPEEQIAMHLALCWKSGSHEEASRRWAHSNGRAYDSDTHPEWLAGHRYGEEEGVLACRPSHGKFSRMRWFSFLLPGRNAALFAAIDFGGMAAVVKALMSGANVNATKDCLDWKGVTPLILAVWNRREVIAKTLIENGANVNLADSSGGAPLHRAAFRGDVGMITLLCKNGGNLNAKNKVGATPYQFALAERHERAIRLIQWIEFSGSPDGFPD